MQMRFVREAEPCKGSVESVELGLPDEPCAPLCLFRHGQETVPYRVGALR